MNTKKRFLIIEDDEASALYLKLLLTEFKDLEYTCTCSGSIDSVVKINQLKPDLVFLDINIRGLEGPEIIKHLDHIPKFIVVSSHDPDYMKSYDMDYLAFLQKPISAEPLKKAVDLFENMNKSTKDFHLA